MSADVCPRCEAEPMFVRGLGKACYNQWRYLGKPDDLAPPLGPFEGDAVRRRAEVLSASLSGAAGRAAGRAAQSRRRAQRLAAYEELTREHGLLLGQACERLGLSRATGTAFEREVTARTGETLTQAHRRLFADLLEAGLPVPAAAQFVHRSPQTGRTWARLLREAS